MNTLLLFLAMTQLQSKPEFPYPEFSMKCYPQTVILGDTIYFMLTTRNPHGKSIYVLDNLDPTGPQIQICLEDMDGRKQPLLFEAMDSGIFDRIFFPTEIEPNNSCII